MVTAGVVKSVTVSSTNSPPKPLEKFYSYNGDRHLNLTGTKFVPGSFGPDRGLVAELLKMAYMNI